MILLNRQRVLFEVMQLVRLRIANRLKISPDSVKAEWVQSEGEKMKPQFSVPSADSDEAETKRVLAEAYETVRGDLFTRLGGLRDRRAT